MYSAVGNAIEASLKVKRFWAIIRYHLVFWNGSRLYICVNMFSALVTYSCRNIPISFDFVSNILLVRYKNALDFAKKVI